MDSVKLAPIDFGIMRRLQEDPRSTVASLAKRLRTPESTVRHRLNRLMEHRIIEFSAVTNPLRLGYHLWVIIEIQAQLPKVQSVARRLAAAPEVSFVAITTGRSEHTSELQSLAYLVCRLLLEKKKQKQPLRRQRIDILQGKLH